MIGLPRVLKTWSLSTPVLAIMLFSLVPTVAAQDAIWSRTPENGVGNWNDSANWSTGAVPTAANTARINNGGTALIDAPSVASRILFGTATNNSGYLEIASGGSLAMAGATMQIGAAEGSDSAITLNGGDFNYTGAATVDIARFGTGVVTVNSGSFSVGGSLRVGVFDRNGQGTINQSGGVINVAGNLALLLGSTSANAITRTAKGDFFQTGGTLNVTGATSVGFSGALAGTSLYEIGNATLNTGTMYIGGGDEGIFRIKDAAADVTIKSSLSLGGDAHIEAVSGSKIKFTDPTGVFVTDATSPYLNQNVYLALNMGVASSVNVAGLANTTFEFAGGELAGANIGLFEVGGTDLGAVEAGFTNNFTLGGLSLGNGTGIGNLKLGDLHLNGAEAGTPAQALYVDALNVTAGSTLDLNGLNLYYRSGSIAGTVLNGTPILVGGAVDNADFNGDGSVDGADFLVWQQNFNSGTALNQGDANDDELVDGADLAIWQEQFGSGGAGAAAVGSVPEPSTIALALLAGLSLAGLRSRNAARGGA